MIILNLRNTDLKKFDYFKTNKISIIYVRQLIRVCLKRGGGCLERS